MGSAAFYRRSLLGSCASKPALPQSFRLQELQKVRARAVQARKKLGVPESILLVPTRLELIEKEAKSSNSVGGGPIKQG